MSRGTAKRADLPGKKITLDPKLKPYGSGFAEQVGWILLCVVILAKRDYLHIDCSRRLRDRIMKAKGSPKAQTNKTNYMTNEAFTALKNALEAALAFERGKRRLRVTRIRAPR